MFKAMNANCIIKGRPLFLYNKFSNFEGGVLRMADIQAKCSCQSFLPLWVMTWSVFAKGLRPKSTVNGLYLKAAWLWNRNWRDFSVISESHAYWTELLEEIKRKLDFCCHKWVLWDKHESLWVHITFNQSVCSLHWHIVYCCLFVILKACVIVILLFLLLENIVYDGKL